MFGMSLPELAVVVMLALIVFGPKRIPQLARTLGRFTREMRRAAAEVRRTIDVEDLRQELRAQNLARQGTADRARPNSPPYVERASTRRTATAAAAAAGGAQAAPTAPGGAEAPGDPVAEDAAVAASLKRYFAQTTADLSPAPARPVALPAQRPIDEDVVRAMRLTEPRRTHEALTTTVVLTDRVSIPEPAPRSGPANEEV